MLGVPLDQRVRRTLAVTVDSGLEVSTSTVASSYFPAHLEQPSGDNAQIEGSPRNSRSTWRLYWQTTAPTLGACDRIEVPGDATYELLAAPRKLLAGRRVIGFSAPALPIQLLYPRSAQVKDKGKAPVLATIECAVFTERDTAQPRGRYTEALLEAPATAFEALTGALNRELTFSDGSVWIVGDVSLPAELPFVTASVRKVA